MYKKESHRLHKKDKREISVPVCTCAYERLTASQSIKYKEEKASPLASFEVERV